MGEDDGEPERGVCGIQERKEVRMKTAEKCAGLVLGLFLIQACGGGGSMPGSQPTPRDQGVAGYGEQPSEQVAGAVASLGSEEEDGGSFATMADMLRGRVPGLQLLQYLEVHGPKRRSEHTGPEGCRLHLLLREQGSPRGDPHQVEAALTPTLLRACSQ